jgi:predicted  nucleic acid-binding Zn-ribbon protein
LELRISTNIQKIRVRERELENRLELVKMESAALIRSKDEMILELKRNIDQLNLELTNYRNKNQELNRLTTDKQEMLRRTVKALRLALSMLEGEEDTQKAPLRKVK